MKALAAFPEYERISAASVDGAENEIPPNFNDGSTGGTISKNPRFGHLKLATGTASMGDFALFVSQNDIHVDAHDAVYVSATFGTEIGAVSNARLNISIQNSGLDGDGVGHTVADNDLAKQHTLFAIDGGTRTDTTTRELLPEGNLNNREQVTSTVVWDNNREEVMHGYQGTRCASLNSGLPAANSDRQVYCLLETQDTASDRVVFLKSFEFGFLKSRRSA